MRDSVSDQRRRATTLINMHANSRNIKGDGNAIQSADVLEIEHLPRGELAALQQRINKVLTMECYDPSKNRWDPYPVTSHAILFCEVSILKLETPILTRRVDENCCESGSGWVTMSFFMLGAPRTLGK